MPVPSKTTAEAERAPHAREAAPGRIVAKLCQLWRTENVALVCSLWYVSRTLKQTTVTKCFQSRVPGIFLRLLGVGQAPTDRRRRAAAGFF